MSNDKIEIEERLDVPESSTGGSYKKSDNVRNARVHTISTADDNVNVTEPSSPYHAQYLHNKVKETLSGHIDEVDDTPGAERLFRMHKSGTMEEIHPEGSKVTKIIGDDFYIVLEDNNLVVGGNLNITVQGDANFLTKGNVKHKIGGDYELTVAGNMTTRVKGTRLDYTKGNQDIQTAGNLKVKNVGTYEHDSTGNYQLSVKGQLNTISNGKTSITSSDKVYVDATQVHFNLPGPNVTFKSIEDADPTGGLTISDSVIEPDITSLKVLITDNDRILSVLDDDVTYPKDRTKDI